MSRLDVDAYLERLGLDHPGPPGVEGLHRLHRAHVERVPYENLEIQLGRPTTVDPLESAERIVQARRGGYCYHLNGAFSELLIELGYRVTRHVAGVQRTVGDAPGITGRHMALTVRGLGHEASPSGAWMVDVGLGSGPHEPLPLHEGTYRQGSFSYGIRPSRVEPRAWRFDQDPRVPVPAGMDFRGREARVPEFARMHEFLSTSPESPFVRVAVVQRRHADGVDVLRGLVLTRLGAGPADVITIETRGAWFDTVEELFGLPLDDVGSREREGLWRRLTTEHAEYARRDSRALEVPEPGARLLD
jgi:arylamine N-acetyltransferase